MCKKLIDFQEKYVFVVFFFFLIRVLVHMWDNDNTEEQTKIAIIY